ncbi:nucleotidyltransferase domain-containing protein [Amycolatopsis sp. NPDC051071]|uniref:nucleotidyltransferase domain-containing protein n=1 Tax=Amycolatopsis sp. NPDC051071 TaxID=3154637 RepID=UPI00341A822F
MFSIMQRTAVRDALLSRARDDAEVRAAALVGSGATGREDAWSDIDLALRIVPTAEPDEVSARWTTRLYDEYDVAHHLDVVAGGVLYRVFLLASSLQIDISFWPDDQFRATEPGFNLIFGTANTPTNPASPDPDHLAGMGWLYGLHARSAIARGRRWQALMMLDGVRDQIIALACVRYGLNPHNGREADKLPAELLDELVRARARTTDDHELRRANEVSIGALVREIARHDETLAQRLAMPVEALARP